MDGDRLKSKSFAQCLYVSGNGRAKGEKGRERDRESEKEAKKEKKLMRVVVLLVHQIL